MRNILILPLLFACSFIQAQNADASSSIDVRTYTDGNKIRLRWIPEDYETWQRGNEHGYKIERIATHFNDSTLSLDEIINSRTTIFYNLKPYAEDLFDQLFDEDSTYAHIAKMTLYEPNPPMTNPDNPALVDAVNNSDNNDIRHLFGVFAADQNFNIARYMGLGYEDPCIEGPSYRYQYFITLENPADSNDIIYGYSNQISLRDTTVFPSPELTAVDGVDRCILQWNPMDYEQYYTSYDIERSFDGVNFTQINDIPYVHLVSDGNEAGWAAYYDSLEIDQSAYYRISGRTPFGIKGPGSNIDTATGLWPRMEIFVNVDTVEFTVSDSQATIFWHSFDNVWTDTLLGFNVYRSTDAQYGYEALESNLLPNSTRSYILPASTMNYYVKVEATDVRGYTYYSMAYLVQPEDHIPPAAPSGLSGKYILERRIELTWDDNTEFDLEGYRVFMGNERNKPMIEITKKAVDIPIYYHDVKAEMEIDSIYFKVIATDQHQNYSEYSDTLALPRPDITPPSSANLFKAYGGIHGIELAWRFSSSDDRTQHILQRRMIGTPVWVEVLSISLDEEDNFLANILPDEDGETNFIDTATLNIREYEYRIKAIDDSDNFSYSQRKIVTPYDPGTRGEIQEVKARFQLYRTYTPDSVAYDAIAQVLDSFQINDTISMTDLGMLENSGAITTSEHDSLIQLPTEGVYLFLIDLVQLNWSDIVKVRIALSWDYDKYHALENFHILRSLNNSAMAPYDVVDGEAVPHHLYIDHDVKPSSLYGFKVYALHGDGGFSPLSDIAIMTIPAF